jgi:uncharacterized iron-regulated membrane protein
MAVTSDAVEAPVPMTKGLYHFVWRWHFYAGLFTAPFLIMLAVTGALYLYKDEIEGFAYPAARVAPPAAAVAASIEEAAVLGAYPGGRITRHNVPIAPERASEWLVTTADGEHVLVFVDPADGRVTGAIDADTRIAPMLFDLHGSLLLGPWGDGVVELAGCWAFVLLVTGVFLWWPRKGRKAGVLAPRLGAKGRGFWRDLHAVPFAWNAPIVAFLILTGLPWSGIWGTNLAKLGTIEAVAPALAPTPNFSAWPSAPGAAAQAPPSGEHAAHAAAPAIEELPHDLPWSVRNAPQPQGSGGPVRVGIDQLMAEAAARAVDGPGLSIHYPADEAGVFTLSFVPDRAEGQRTVHIDPASGAVIADIAWAQYSPLGKAVEFGVETHVGRQFGEANRLLMLTSCILIVLTVAFGIVMWWRRRPPGRLGVPPVPEGFRAGWVVLAPAIGLGLVFPLVGASMILILIAEIIAGRVTSARLAKR